MNATLDAEPRAVGTPPTNAGFEVAPYATGSGPANGGFDAATVEVGSPPANHDFASGDFAGWTTGGAPTIQTDATRRPWAKLVSGATVTTDAFVVDATAQVFAFEAGFLSGTSTAGFELYVLTGAGFATATRVAQDLCSACGRWETRTGDAVPYRGQTVKLRVGRYLGDVGVDAVRQVVALPNYGTVGAVRRATEADGNGFAALAAGTSGVATSVTSATFSVAADAQYATVRVRGLSTTGDQYRAALLSGPGFGTSTAIGTGTAADGVWTTLRVNVAAFRGQQVRLNVERVATGALGVDDVGAERVEVPDWEVTRTASVVAGGPSGAYLTINGELTSQAFALPADVQQVSVRHKQESSGGSFELQLLTGADFSTVVPLSTGVSGDPAAWRTYKAAVATHAGQTVKLRLKTGIIGRMAFDEVGLGEGLLAGWAPTTRYALAAGTDAFGGYVTADELNGAITIRSTTVATGLVDRPSAVD